MPQIDTIHRSTRPRRLKSRYRGQLSPAPRVPLYFIFISLDMRWVFLALAFLVLEATRSEASLSRWGYLPLSDPSGTSNLFYWIVESEGNMTADPVVLWLSGGFAHDFLHFSHPQTRLQRRTRLILRERAMES